MATTFRDIPALHRLLESAPIESLHTLLLQVDAREYAIAFLSVEWPLSPDNALEERTRQQLLRTASQLKVDVALPLERHAERLLTLAEGHGADALARRVLCLSADEQATYTAQRDHYGRAIWMYLTHEVVFEEAENLFYAEHYRHLGVLYEAFEVDARGTLDFDWSGTIQAALEAQVQQALELSDPCKIDYLHLTDQRADGTVHPAHMLLFRHAGPLSSIAVMNDGRKKPLYYRPAIEATLLFSPREAVIEVYAESPGLRPLLASTFAQIGLQHDLSGRPLMLRQYNLSRFLTSFQLDAPPVPGFTVEQVRVIEAEVCPPNPKHRATLRVTRQDDIEVVAAALFGENHVFQRATLIKKVVIAIRYVVDGETKAKGLTITLSDPHRCSLRSQRNPVQRKLGFILLEHWGVMKRIRPLEVTEESALFPALLHLYDRAEDEVSYRFLESRGIPLQPLLEGGFLLRRGRRDTAEVELEDGHWVDVSVEPSPQPGQVRYRCPLSQQWVEIPAQHLDEYQIKTDWMNARLVKALRHALNAIGQPLHEEAILFLGQLQLDGEIVPTYLARRLGKLSVVRDVDAQLRARHAAGVGIVLTSTHPAPAFLGAHVVVSIASLIVADTPELTLDLVRLKNVYHQGKVLARGGQTVSFIVDRNRTGTLCIPGKLASTIKGAQQIKIIQRLVTAYQSGNPAVATKDLIDGTGVKSPSQAFRDWKSTYLNVYIGQTGKRGAWQLLV